MIFMILMWKNELDRDIFPIPLQMGSVSTKPDVIGGNNCRLLFNCLLAFAAN